MKLSPFAKKALISAVAALSIVVGMGVPANATGDGVGTFEGHEHATEAEFVPGSTNFCAKFPAGTEHHHLMEGTFHGTPGIGTARYVATADYWANPEGTWSHSGCTGTPYAVPGDMWIDFTPWTCSGTGHFSRRLTSVYTLTFNGSCNDVPTKVTFTGIMEPCDPLVGCPVVHPGSQQTEFADALMEGAYEQTH